MALVERNRSNRDSGQHGKFSGQPIGTAGFGTHRHGTAGRRLGDGA